MDATEPVGLGNLAHARTLPAALRPVHPGDSLPDLGTLLPLL